MPASSVIMCLDVGEKRIGVAHGDLSVRLASPYTTIEVDGQELSMIQKVYSDLQAENIVVGYPRNQSGEATKQTEFVIEFARQLEQLGFPVAYQDESLTSVLAEDQLKKRKRPYSKGDIDALAAALILQDYLETN